MSTANTVLNTGQQAITNYDTSKIFLRDNRFQTESYNNSSYDPVTLPPARLMGRVSATNKIVPHSAAANDGSQYPVGILNQGRVVADGDEVEVSICTAGDVAEELIVLAAGNTMDTVISGRTIRDRIASDTLGIKLVRAVDHTAYDNQ